MLWDWRKSYQNFTFSFLSLVIFQNRFPVSSNGGHFRIKHPKRYACVASNSYFVGDSQFTLALFRLFFCTASDKVRKHSHGLRTILCGNLREISRYLPPRRLLYPVYLIPGTVKLTNFHARLECFE